VSCSRTHRLGWGLNLQPPDWKTNLLPTDPQTSDWWPLADDLWRRWKRCIQAILATAGIIRISSDFDNPCSFLSHGDKLDHWGSGGPRGVLIAPPLLPWMRKVPFLLVTHFIFKNKNYSPPKFVFWYLTEHLFEFLWEFRPRHAPRRSRGPAPSPPLPHPPTHAFYYVPFSAPIILSMKIN